MINNNFESYYGKALAPFFEACRKRWRDRLFIMNVECAIIRNKKIKKIEQKKQREQKKLQRFIEKLRKNDIVLEVQSTIEGTNKSYIVDNFMLIDLKPNKLYYYVNKYVKLKKLGYTFKKMQGLIFSEITIRGVIDKKKYSFNERKLDLLIDKIYEFIDFQSILNKECDGVKILQLINNDFYYYYSVTISEYTFTSTNLLLIINLYKENKIFFKRIYKEHKLMLFLFEVPVKLEINKLENNTDKKANSTVRETQTSSVPKNTQLEVEIRQSIP